MQYQK